jgi:hypothetical protein
MSFYFNDEQSKEDIMIFHFCILAILLCMLLLCYLTKGVYLTNDYSVSIEGMSPSSKPMEADWSLFNRNPYDDIDYQTPVFIRQTSFH